jgi:methyl-accepting chemotaxis protein PixJ
MNSLQLPLHQKISQFVRSNLVSVIISSVCLNSMLNGAATWNIWNTSRNLQITVERHDRLQNLSNQMIYLDEVLTMSINMVVSNGQPQWEKRYQDNVLLFNPVMKEFLQNVAPSDKDIQQQFNTASDQLFKIESQVLQLVKEQKLTAASASISGEQYVQQKKNYASSIQTLIAHIKNISNDQVLADQRILELSIALELLSLILSVINTVGIIIAVRGYIREQKLTQDALWVSQNSLLSTNDVLEQEIQQRQELVVLTQQENEQFQADVSKLLDVVSEIESGDLTIQAPVNNRVTGLVNDKINRLTEELGKILGQVAGAARRVEANGRRQKNITTMVTGNIDRQTKSMGKVLRSTKTMRQSAQNALQQLDSTNKSLTILQSAVTDGHRTIANLDQDIDVLQIGSDRIVQEIKTLSEFIGLTDQFVQDQGEIVTQTQILALNAALVAARAAEQRDPQQFTIVAREFELIANQVSQLAQETNAGLTNLEQRSSQIHRVVSAVNINVQQLGGLVNSFTKGVKYTREVFLNVQSVTTQAVQAGETVSIASQRIVGAADLTVTGIESIATLAQQILQQSQDAQQLGDQLDLLSQDLLNNIQVFKLPLEEIVVSSEVSEDSEVIEPVPMQPLLA